jgi:hypothetical protein
MPLPPSPFLTDHPYRWAYIISIWAEWNTLTPVQQQTEIGKTVNALSLPIWP